MGVAIQRPFFLLFLLVSFHAHSSRGGGADARPLPSPNQERYMKLLATLGIACQCCDGAGGACRSTWASPCEKLECRPWRLA